MEDPVRASEEGEAPYERVSFGASGKVRVRVRVTLACGMCLWVLLWCALWCALCRMFRDGSAAGSGSEDEDEGSDGSAGSMDDFLDDSAVYLNDSPGSPMQVTGSPTQQTTPPSLVCTMALPHHWANKGRH